MNEFEKAFCPSGYWAALLRRSVEYLGTEFRPEPEELSRYRVVDYWRSHWGFEVFREKYQRELEEFSRVLAGAALVEREVFKGSFYENDPSTGDGADAVPS